MRLAEPHESIERREARRALPQAKRQRDSPAIPDRILSAPREWPPRPSPERRVAQAWSAVPALEQVVRERAICLACRAPGRKRPKVRVERSEFGREAGQGCVGLAEAQVIAKSPLAIRADDRLALPVGRRPVTDVGVHRRARAGADDARQWPC